MFKALAWKEWREQRAVVLAAMVLAFCLPPVLAAGKWLLNGRIDAHAVAVDTLMVYSMLLWPLTALLVSRQQKRIPDLARGRLHRGSRS